MNVDVETQELESQLHTVLFLVSTRLVQTVNNVAIGILHVMKTLPTAMVALQEVTDVSYAIEADEIPHDTATTSSRRPSPPTAATPASLDGPQLIASGSLGLVSPQPLASSSSRLDHTRSIPIPPVIRNNFILLCSDRGDWLTTRDDFDVTNIRSDQQLFRAFRHRRGLRKPWLRRLLGLTTIQRISFVKASNIHVLHTCELTM